MWTLKVVQRLDANFEPYFDVLVSSVSNAQRKIHRADKIRVVKDLDALYEQLKGIIEDTKEEIGPNADTLTPEKEINFQRQSC